MPVLSLCVSYRSSDELYRAVEKQLYETTKEPVEIKKASVGKEFANKISIGGYDDRPYDVQTLSERWHCSENFVREQIKRGELVAYKAGKRYFITPSNVKKYEGERI